MAIYRARRQTPWKGWVLAAAVMVAAVVVTVRLAVRQNSTAEPVGPAVERMAATADVLRLSHYTPEAVRDGQVVLEGEYQAALEDVRHLRQDWERIRSLLPTERAAGVDRTLNLLEAQVHQRRPAEEVAATAEQLIEELRAEQHRADQVPTQ